MARLTNSLVHIRHELVEMAAQLWCELREIEEQICQHRLAATYGPADIEAARRRIAGTAEQRAQTCTVRLPELQARQQVVEPACDIELRGVSNELFAGNLRAQALGHILGHRRKDPPQRAHFPQ